jgi:hypothetical protein
VKKLPYDRLSGLKIISKHLMDSLQHQINTLNGKVDTLHHLTEQLSCKFSELLMDLRVQADDEPVANLSIDPYIHSELRNLRMGLEHKDILMDSGYPTMETPQGDRKLAPEIQIQRLTAQLTAAYNRIAALEEQLLSKRVF